MDKKNAHTTLRIGDKGAGLKYVSENYINPDKPFPQNKGLRFIPSYSLLGKLERLAKARFEISQLTEDDLDNWQTNRDKFKWQIVQSVNASSEIEGEHVSVENLELALAAVTDTGLNVEDDELKKRIEAIKSIYETYVWALSLDRESFITFDFILEVHDKMFRSTKGENAGKLKEHKVKIIGAGYNIETLPVEKTEEFLIKLCERTNERLTQGKKTSSFSMFITVSEFLLDFLSIHPFEDGNGRTARLLSTYLLERAGYHFARFYPLDSIILETRDEYYRALYEAQQNWYSEQEDITEWIEYYTMAVFNQWIRAYQRVLDESQK